MMLPILLLASTTLTVDVSGAGLIAVTSNAATSCADPQTESQWKLRANVPLHVTATELARADRSAKSEVKLVRALLTGRVRCGDASPKVVMSVKRKQLAATRPIVRDKDPRRFVWRGWDAPALLHIALGAFPPRATPYKCTFRHARTAVPKVSCSLAIVGGQNAGLQFLFTADQDVSLVDEIVVTGDQTRGAANLTVPVQTCRFFAEGPLPRLFRGASLQRLALASNNQVCANALAAERRVSLENGSVVIRGVGVPGAVQLESIPGDLPTGTPEWIVRAQDGSLLGHARIEATGAGVTVQQDDASDPQLQVSYENKALDRLHSGVSVDGFAVVTEHEGVSDVYAENSATLTMDDDLRRLTRELLEHRKSSPCGEMPKGLSEYKARTSPAGRRKYEAAVREICDADTPKKIERLEIPAAISHSEFFAQSRADKAVEVSNAVVARELRRHCEHKVSEIVAEIFAVDDKALDKRDEQCRQARFWHLDKPTWGRKLWFKLPYDGVSWWDHSAVAYDDPTQVTFSIVGSRSNELETTVQLKDGDIVYFEAKLTLARGARVESLPLPVRELLFVTCGDESDIGVEPSLLSVQGVLPYVDVALSGETRAIDDVDIETGRCRLHYEPQRLRTLPGFGERKQLRVGGHPQSRDVLKYFGEQDILIVVDRDGTDPVQIKRSFDPTASAAIPLPVLEDGDGGTGPYRVRATLIGPRPADVRYRPTDASSTDGTTATRSLGEMEFRATLRPRGAFGWSSLPIRTFVTFPVDVVGWRFPSRPRELRSSSSPTSVQTIRPKLGVVFAVEPWNYDLGENSWPIPLRFVTGMHFFDFSDGIAPSWITGISATLPIIDLPKGRAQEQLGTDLALGLLWEVDLGNVHSFDQRNAFLITLGVNVLSVFGSK